jgi:hypothetical protein
MGVPRPKVNYHCKDNSSMVLPDQGRDRINEYLSNNDMPMVRSSLVLVEVLAPQRRNIKLKIISSIGTTYRISKIQRKSTCLRCEIIIHDDILSKMNTTRK